MGGKIEWYCLQHAESHIEAAQLGYAEKRHQSQGHTNGHAHGDQ